MGTRSSRNTLLRSPAVLKRKCFAGYALIGTSILGVGSFSAQSIRFQAQHLYGWLGRSGLDRATTQTARSFDVRYVEPDEEWFSLDRDLAIGIHTTSSTQSSLQERSIREHAALTFRCESGLSFAQCQKLVGAIRTLLHMAALEPVYPVWMTAQLTEAGKGLEFNRHRRSVEIWSGGLRKSIAEFQQPEQWIFRLEDVHQDFGGFMQGWLEYTDRNDEALGCYSCTVYHPLTWELQHLSLTQALDAYHGVKFASHSKRGFRRKIEDLCKPHVTGLGDLVKDPAEFADAVVCTRDYYTHHNPEDLRSGKVAKDVDLFRMNERLRLLFQMCVLTDLGIPAERFHRLRRQLATDVISFE